MIISNKIFEFSNKNSIKKLNIIFVFIILCNNIFSMLFASEEKAYKFELSIASIFQNEAPYIKEWIEFHKLVGVQHFYLYNNLSTDNFLEVLLPYIEKGEVELIEWPYAYSHEKEKSTWLKWNKIQKASYDDAIRRSSSKTKWLAFIDLDEFLFPVIEDNLVAFLKNYEEFGGLCVSWQMYGTSFVKKIPVDKLLIESLYLKANLNESSHYFVKSIVRPERVNKCVSAHSFSYVKPFFSVDSDKNFCGGRKAGGPENILINQIRINHYWTRDENYFRNVKIANRKKRGWDLTLSMNRYNNFNKEKDISIFKYIEPLRQIIKIKSKKKN